jgi:hypothetical protein
MGFRAARDLPEVVTLPARAFVNVGSVGQPRDGDKRSSYVVVDGDTVRFRRVVVRRQHDRCEDPRDSRTRPLPRAPPHRGRSRSTTTMDKRLIGFFVIAFGILVLRHADISPKIWPPKPMPPAASRPAEVAPTSAPSGATTTSPVAAAAKARVPDAERKSFVLENDRVKIVLSNVGAVIEERLSEGTPPARGRFRSDAPSASLPRRGPGLELRYLADPSSQFESRAWEATYDAAANRVVFTASQP